jgi:hypothetical protein
MPLEKNVKILHDDSSDNLHGDHVDACCASEIDSNRIGMVAAFSNSSDLACNFDHFLEKCTSQVHLTLGADIIAMTVLLRWGFKNAASALDRTMEAPLQCPPWPIH